MATKSSSKRARVSISVSLKKKICAYKKSHPKATQEEIRSFIFKEDSVDIGRTTISDILRDADKWASVEDSSSTKHCQGCLRSYRRLFGFGSAIFALKVCPFQMICCGRKPKCLENR